MKKINISTEEYIRRAKEIHGDKYDYSLTKYKCMSEKVSIICPIHGLFQQRALDHLKGYGCRHCGAVKRGKKRSFSTEQFIAKATIIHNNKYDYSLTEYTSSREKVNIICPEHGVFEQDPRLHLKGTGCPKCSGRMNDKEDFLNKSIEIHGDIYDYSKVNYIDHKTKVCITCKKHGSFWMSPENHTRGQKCPKCQRERISDSQRYNTSSFIIKALAIHGDKYDYSKVKYINSSTKVIITCPIHGDFKQKPSNHLSGVDCPTCAKERLAQERTYDTRKYIDLAHKVHGEKYDYSLVEYKKSNEEVNIICKKHGIFKQTPAAHLRGHGCPICKASSGERVIKNYLDENNYIYESEYRIKNSIVFCKNKYFRVDFYLPTLNTIIEYNGIQHYESSDYFGGESNFELQKERDIALKQFCYKNKTKLIEIPYTEFKNIDSILNKNLKGKR